MIKREPIHRTEKTRHRIGKRKAPTRTRCCTLHVLLLNDHASVDALIICLQGLLASSQIKS